MPGEADISGMGSPEGLNPQPSATASGSVVPPAGEIEVAKANVSIAISVLERSLAQLGSHSEEGKAVLAALSSLSKKFSGKKSEDLAPAELMGMMGSQPDATKQAMMKEMGAAGGGAPTSGVPTS